MRYVITKNATICSNTGKGILKSAIYPVRSRAFQPGKTVAVYWGESGRLKGTFHVSAFDEGTNCVYSEDALPGRFEDGSMTTFGDTLEVL